MGLWSGNCLVVYVFLLPSPLCFEPLNEDSILLRFTHVTSQDSVKTADDQASITPPPYTPSPIYESPYNSHQFDPIVHSDIRASSGISPWVGVQYSP
jgi:hypothetical protein